jgi:hypothetical protein
VSSCGPADVQSDYIHSSIETRIVFQCLQVTEQEAAAVKSLDSRRLKNVMLDNSAYPKQFPDRSNLEFEIPFGMFANGNRIEEF